MCLTVRHAKQIMQILKITCLLTRTGIIHVMSVNSARCEFDGRLKRTQFLKKLGKSQEKDPVILKLIDFSIGLFC